MILLKSINLLFSNKTIFDDVDIFISQNQRIGVVGRNGAGKSTLLRIITSDIKVDSGIIEIDKNKKIAYLPQEFTFLSTKTVFEEAFSVFDHYNQLKLQKLDLESNLESNISLNPEKDLDLYVKITQELEKFNEVVAIENTKNILKNLGFSSEDFNKSVKDLSVGWKMRLLLSKLLLQEADFYLFDEPTNHLDINTKLWFHDFLKNSKFGFLLVTHDRYFLDNSCDYILELERGKAKIFTGNYSKYLLIKEQQNEILENAYKKQQKEIERKQELIDRFRYKATKAKMAQSLIKQLDKLDVIEVESKSNNLKLKFPVIDNPGKVILRFKNLKKFFNDKLIFNNISGEIQRDDKVAIVAANGIGKTTFINLLIGKYSLDDQKSSLIEFGHNVKHAIFEQDQLLALDLENTVYQEIVKTCSKEISESSIRSTLGSFLFTKDDINKKVAVLSGGERNRLAMVKILLSKANFLILDEPTNHLDLQSKEILLQALKQYSGTILFVSHDQDFLSKLANKLFILSKNEIYVHHGNYDSYIFWQKNNQAKLEFKSQDKKENILSSSDINQYKKELNSVELKISKLEKDIEKINSDFLNYEYGTDKYFNNVKLLESAKSRLEEYNNKWENLLQKLDN